MIDEQWKPRRALDVRMRKIRQQLYLARGPEVYELEDVGSRIWQLIDGTRSIGDISRLVTDEFDVDADQAKGDVKRFVDELVEANLLEIDLRAGEPI